MDGAPVRSIQLAQQKAYTCTRMGSTTDAFLARLRKDDVPIGYFCDPLLTALPGGAVLSDAQGNMIGGVGVSGLAPAEDQARSEEHTSELQSLMRISYAVFCLKEKTTTRLDNMQNTKLSLR